MSELVTKTDAEMGVIDWLQSERFRQQLEYAAPRGVQAVRFARVAESLIMNDTSGALIKCERRSLLNAVMICAQTGLEPGPIGHAAIVPYKGKAQWQAMYRGMLHLMHRSEQIASVQAGVVREKDNFDYDEGSKPFVEWKKPMLPEADRGDIVCVFCALIPRQGSPYVGVMHISDVEAIRDKYSKGKRDDRPWVTAFDSMAMKTIIKRVAKLAPISIEAARAVSYDDLNEVGKDTPDIMPPDIGVGDLPSQQDYCNNELGEGIVCGRDPGHPGECQG